MDKRKHVEKGVNKKKITVVAAVAAAGLVTVGVVFSGNNLKHMIDSGESITIEVANPAYTVSALGAHLESVTWVPLDQLKTYNNLRLDFDTLLNINKITVNGVNSKSGSLYVGKENMQEGNSTLENAFRNKVFVTRYWNNADMRAELSKLSASAYSDETGTASSSIWASLNAYYNLLADGSNPDSFNAMQSLSREQFYSLVYKSTNGVTSLTNDIAYTNATGGETDNSIYAQQVDEYAYLNVKENCLDKSNAQGSISRAEAVYMVVNEFFSKQLSEVTGKEDSYSDVKNAGDLASKVGFKEKDGTGKTNWQAYTLAYMMQNPDKGMQEELYKAMVVAYNNGLLGSSDTDSRWDEPISKVEGISLMANVFLALNESEGYVSDVEYGEHEENTINDGVNVSDITDMPTANDMTSSGLTLGEIRDMVTDMRPTLESIGNPSEEEVNESLDGLAKKFGTTLQVINSIVDTPVAVPINTGSKPVGNDSTANNTTPAQKPTTPSNSNSGNGQTSQHIDDTENYVRSQEECDALAKQFGWVTSEEAKNMTSTSSGNTFNSN